MGGLRDYIRYCQGNQPRIVRAMPVIPKEKKFCQGDRVLILDGADLPVKRGTVGMVVGEVSLNCYTIESDGDSPKTFNALTCEFTPLLPNNTRIRFTKTLGCDATGDHPAFTYCERDTLGTIIGHGCKEGYYVLWDRWKQAAFCCGPEDFEVAYGEKLCPGSTVRFHEAAGLAKCDQLGIIEEWVSGQYYHVKLLPLRDSVSPEKTPSIMVSVNHFNVIRHSN